MTTRSRLRLRARAGLTLMELVVTVMIIGIIALIGGSAFSSIVDHRTTIMMASAETERASALRDMLRSWIGSATIQIQTTNAQGRTTISSFNPGGTIGRTTISISGQAVTTQAQTITAAASTGDELTFVTNALTPTMTPNTRVRLFVDGDASTAESGLTIEYQASTATPLQRMQLDSTIVMMTVEFLDGTTNRWVPFAEAGTIRPIAARLYFPPVENYYVPELLQYPMLFVISSAPATTGRGGGP